MTESTQHSETSETNQQAVPEQSGRELLAKFLTEGESQEAGEAGESQHNAEPKAGEPQGKPKVFKELAERLSLAPEDLYAVEIDLGRGDGKTMSLGKMKDAAAKSDDIEVRELAFEERVAEQEAKWTRSQTEFSELVSALGPAAIKPELREKIAAKVAADAKRENELTLEHIPQWKDQTVREAELAGMVEHLRDYGIHEGALLASNHKMRRLIRQAYLDRKKIRDAAANVVKVTKTSTTGKSAGGNGAPRKSQPVSQTRGKTARDRLNTALGQ